MNEITIIVKGKAGTGKSTIASHIATILSNEGFDVVANDSDEIQAKFNTPERIDALIRNDTMICIHHEQEPRTGTK